MRSSALDIKSLKTLRLPFNHIGDAYSSLVSTIVLKRIDKDEVFRPRFLVVLSETLCHVCQQFLSTALAWWENVRFSSIVTPKTLLFSTYYRSVLPILTFGRS